ncbi:MAG: ABC transporter ATP-binding protein [Acidimicrobiales bacterium]
MSRSWPIELRGVSKFYGDVVAVSDVTLLVDHGLTALLGPNGAGKTTLLRIMAGQTPPSIGTAELLGVDPRNDVEVLGRIAMVPQQEALFDALTAHEFVELAARLHGVADPADVAALSLQRSGMDPSLAKPIKTFSKGMRQRVKIAQSLVNDPEVLFLDEPLNGLDPRQRQKLIQLFHDLGENGVCVLVSSHVLEEVEKLGSQIIMISKGRLAARGDFRTIRSMMDDRAHRILVRTNDARALSVGLLNAAGVSGLDLVSETEISVRTNDVAAFRQNIATVARDSNLALHEVRPLDDDLESVFRYLTDGGPR